MLIRFSHQVAPFYSNFIQFRGLEISHEGHMTSGHLLKSTESRKSPHVPILILTSRGRAQRGLQ